MVSLEDSDKKECLLPGTAADASKGWFWKSTLLVHYGFWRKRMWLGAGRGLAAFTAIAADSAMTGL